jgi:SAM-dependent methyltransferase
MRSDHENLLFADDLGKVDALNAKFYGNFPYPWPPMAFESVADAALFAQMLAQDVGDWSREFLPGNGMHIWVAGCGTNQAVFTALKFPNATVVGSDLSAPSLELAERSAKDLGLQNLILRRESLNEVAYDQQFDYVICTGVIHHNAYPAAPLAKLATALKPAGILELMVYNRYHRTVTTAFQNAMRILTRGSTDFHGQFPIAKGVISALGADGLMAMSLRESMGLPDAAFADMWLQPVEHSYTVESLKALLTRCDLVLVGPCVNQFDKVRCAYLWNINFEKDAELARTYESLEDKDRWQITNLFLLEKSPMLWVYAQRSDSPRSRKSEHQLADEFLAMKWARIRSECRSFVRDSAGAYQQHPSTRPFPPVAALRDEAKVVYEALDAQRPMKDTLRKLGISPSFNLATKLRMELTSSAFPYLRALT